jgi:hypothetical protein
MQSNGSNLTAIDVQIDTEEYDDNIVQTAVIESRARSLSVAEYFYSSNFIVLTLHKTNLIPNTYATLCR